MRGKKWRERFQYFGALFGWPNDQKKVVYVICPSLEQKDFFEYFLFYLFAVENLVEENLHIALVFFLLHISVEVIPEWLQGQIEASTQCN